jgi:hypothetical protein
MPNTDNAARTKMNASNPKLKEMPNVAIRTPAIAGPAAPPRVAMVWLRARAAGSNSRETRDGVTAIRVEVSIEERPALSPESTNSGHKAGDGIAALTIKPAATTAWRT